MQLPEYHRSMRRCISLALMLVGCGCEGKQQAASGTDTGGSGSSETVDVPTTGSSMCESDVAARPEGIALAWFEPGEDGDIWVILSGSGDACGGLPELPCQDGAPVLQGYVLTLGPGAQAPGVYSLSVVNDGPKAVLGISVKADYGDGCESRGAYIDAGQVELFLVSPDCISLELRDVPPLDGFGLPFDPNGMVAASSCS
jgi:hypothetical protein